jgi:hypothetical protein
MIGAHDDGRRARLDPAHVGSRVSQYGAFDLDMEQRLDRELRGVA